MPRKRRACDKCYRYKEKCIFEDDAETCTHCERSSSPCTTLRSQHRQGRRPKIKSLGPNGSVQIWDIGNTPARKRSSHKLIENGTQPTTCVAIETFRSHSFQSYRVPAPRQFLLQLQLRHADNLRHSSPSLVNRFTTTYEIFMIGPTFAPEYRAAVQRSYMAAPSLLQDIYNVIRNIADGAREHPGIWDPADLAGGTTSLQKLRTARIAGIQDALAINSLGLSLAGFELLTNCMCSVSILRYSLSSIQPWYGELSRNPATDLSTITPIFWDTIDCLIRREIPVIRFFSTNSHIVDHTAGLCATLMLIFYDLCVASNTLKQSGATIDTEDLRHIQERLVAWAPEHPSDFSSTFTERETLGMKAQASMFQMAGLLVVHRILNPIGTLDDIASSFANTIMAEFSKYSAAVGPGTKLPHVAFPCLMAAFEIETVPEDIWKSITLLAVAPLCAAKMLAMVDYVWIQRRSGFTGYLLDLVDSGPEFTVLP